MHHSQRGFGIVEIIAVTVLVGLVGFGGWYLLQPRSSGEDPPSSSQAQTQTTDPAPNPALPTTKKYTNTKHRYSFEYPADAKIYSDTPHGGQVIPITPESDVAIVEFEQSKFSISPLLGNNELNTEMIYSWFSSYRIDQIKILPVTIGNATGFRVNLNDSDANHYFLKRILTSPIFYAEAINAESVVETIRFE